MKLLKIIRSLISILAYRCWLVFGGKRTESGFKLLSASIIEQRKMIHELRSKIRELEDRVWELEEHTPQEYLERAEKGVQEWGKEVEHYIRQSEIKS